MNATPGSIRVLSKRKGSPAAHANETIVDVDRSHPVLGNRHYLNDPNDDEERARVIAAHKVDFDADIARKGPMFLAISSLAARVSAGENIALRCWCSPKPCHGDHEAAKVAQMAGIDYAPTIPELKEVSSKRAQMGLF